MNEEKVLLEILKSLIENREYFLEQVIDEEKLYKLAVKHKVSNFLEKWAKNDCKSEKIKELVLADYNSQIIKDTNENIELEKILNSFEEAKIETLLVKGVLMKELYPNSFMRQMCDIDIMIHNEDFKKASKIMRCFGYEKFYDYEKHLIFSKKPFIMLEMHRRLVRDRDIASEYLNNNTWDLSMKYKNYDYIKQLTTDNAYFFCIVHLFIHFTYTGISIRDILDVYLFNERYGSEIDFSKVNQLFDKYNLSDFEKNIKKIAYKWFGKKNIEDFDDVEKFILHGQSINNQVNYKVGENSGKVKYLLKLLFPKYKIMKEKYPVLKKVPILLPLTWIARIFKDIFSRETTIKTRLYTIKLIKNTNIEEVENIKKIYQKIGIKGEEK